MPLDAKPDLERTLERFEAWWAGEVIDRPPVNLQVHDTRSGVEMPESRHATERERWMDVEYQLALVEAKYTGRNFVGDTLPMAMANVGPEACATLFGAELEFTPYTSYSKPVAGSSRDVLSMEPNFKNPYWRFLREMTDALIEHGEGKWLTGYPDLHTNADLLAALRDPQALMLEMAEDPGLVREAVDHLTQYFRAIYDDFHNRTRAANLPSLTWAPAPCRGRMYVCQSDTICMISSKMFSDIVRPSLVEEMRQADRTLFHLDGPQALRHLDSILEIPEMDAVQWVYGAGNGPAAKWAEVYKRIQAAGKGMQLLCEDIDDARQLMQHLKPAGCWFSISGSYETEEAERFLRDLEKWTRSG